MSSLAVRFDERAKNLDPPDHRHQIDAHNPIPTCVGPLPIEAGTANSRIVDQNMNLAISRDGSVRGGLELRLERDVCSYTINISVGELQGRHRLGQRL